MGVAHLEFHLKTFRCDNCGNHVYFENVRCIGCDHALGFLPDGLEVCAFEPQEGDRWRALNSTAENRIFRQCANGRQHQVCNWMVPEAESDPLCAACRLNNLVPDLGVPGNQERWYKLELAKRRTIYTILQLNLPLAAGTKEQPALGFSFLADSPDLAPVTTGHNQGLITINIAEADDDKRERRRINLHEPYRTLLGHMRHEVGHYYWDRLIAHSDWLSGFREVFGNEATDYAGALNDYYKNGPPADWQERGVSAYASSHPWEDWAETWAHYFHVVIVTRSKPPPVSA